MAGMCAGIYIQKGTSNLCCLYVYAHTLLSGYVLTLAKQHLGGVGKEWCGVEVIVMCNACKIENE